MSRDVCHFLFHESNPSGPLINRLKWCCLKIRFREDIREIGDSAHSTQANTARSRKLKYRTPRDVSLRRVLPGTILSLTLCRPLLALNEKTKKNSQIDVNYCDIAQHSLLAF